MKNIKMKAMFGMIGFIALIAIIGFGVLSCDLFDFDPENNNNNSGNTTPGISSIRYETVQVGSPAFNQALGLGSARNVNEDESYVLIKKGRLANNSAYYYLYYLGYVNYVPIESQIGDYFDGRTRREIKLTITNSTSDTVTKSLTEAVSQTVDQSTSTTVSAEVKVGRDFGFVEAEVTAGISHTWNQGVSNTVSTSNTVTTSNTWVNTNTMERTVTLGNDNEPPGMYRWVLNATTDVFVQFRVNPVTWAVEEEEMIYSARPASLGWRLDYDSGEGGFGKTGTGDRFEIPNIDFQSLGIPTDIAKPMLPRTVRRDITTAGSPTVNFGPNENVPNGTSVTVEVYTVGGGGGGQGGHRKAYMQGLGQRFEYGGGAGGGGGATAYMKFETVTPINFNEVTVGAGGAGGNALSEPVGGSWISGHGGSAGGITTVRFGGGLTLIANGGGGGAQGSGSSGQNQTGGTGGTASAPSDGIINRGSADGTAGGNGSHNSTNWGAAGRRGQLNIGTENFTGTTGAGTGGRGGQGNDERGTNGSTGRVLIIYNYTSRD